MVPGRLIYCPPAAKDLRCIARFCRSTAQPLPLGIKLSSSGTLTTFFGQKYDIARITPMTKLAILEYPDPRLRKTAKPVEGMDDAVRQLVADLLETMYAAKGVGLAATQVDVHRRVLVLDVSEERSHPLVFINPEILSAEGRGPGEEGCLSVPNIYDKVQRATHIRFRALGLDGQPFEMEADGLLAICVQHEIDHLDGKLFVDYLSELKRQLIRRRLEKDRKQRSVESETRSMTAGVAAASATPVGVQARDASVPAI